MVSDNNNICSHLDELTTEQPITDGELEQDVGHVEKLAQVIPEDVCDVSVVEDGPGDAGGEGRVDLVGLVL